MAGWRGESQGVSVFVLVCCSAPERLFVGVAARQYMMRDYLCRFGHDGWMPPLSVLESPLCSCSLV